jgi:hypothetical protein
MNEETQDLNKKMKVESTEVTSLIKEKHELYRRLDRKEITQEKFDEEEKRLEKEIDSRVKVYVDKENEKQKAHDVQREEKVEEIIKYRKGKTKGVENMVEPNETKVEKKPVAEKKEKKASIKAEAVKALMLKSVKNVDEVVARLQDKFPEKDKEKLVAYVKHMVYNAKRNGPGWSKYNFDKENFLLTLKE